jgi:two-component system, OmpR family, sensor histidine kinase KdpD
MIYSSMLFKRQDKEQKNIILQYMEVVGVVAIAATLCYVLKDLIGYRSVSFVLLFTVSFLAIFFGTGPNLLASLLSALIWDFFFIPPSFTFQIGETEDTLMLVMFLIVALVNGILTTRIKRQEQKAREREETNLALYQLTKELLTANGLAEVISVAQKYFIKYFDLNPIIVLWEENGTRKVYSLINSEKILSEEDEKTAVWVYKNSKKAGRYSDINSLSELTFYPLDSSGKCVGVICMWLSSPIISVEEQFLEAFISLIAGKIEREFLSLKAKDAFLLEESDKLYKTLFNSISHELRIPVAAILGATDTLLYEKYPEQTRKRLYSEMATACLRLNRLIENLLNMSRLESGHLRPRPDWCDVHDIINKVTGNLKQELELYVFVQEISEDMPLVFIDFGLTEQAIYNLILNAIQHSPERSVIRASFLCNKEDTLIIEISDSGKGFNDGEMELLFNKFFRGENAVSGGTGLGLSIVKGFVEAQGGKVSAANRKEGGALFRIEIPVSVSEISEVK